MKIKESEIRALVRQKIMLSEGTGMLGFSDDEKEIAKEASAGLGVGLAALGAIGYAGAAPIASAAIASSPALAAGASGATALGVGGSAVIGAGLTKVLGLGAAAIGWPVALAVGVAAASYYIWGGHSDTSALTDECLDSTLYTRWQEMIEVVQEELRKAGRPEDAAKLEGEPTLISDQEAIDFAKEIYVATKGGYLSTFGIDLGIGTWEDEVAETLRNIPTILDVSKVSAIFKKLYKGSWSFTPTLKAVFESEFNSEAEQFEFVETPLREKMETAYVSINGRPMSLEEWSEWSDLSKEAVDAIEDYKPASGVSSELDSEEQVASRSGGSVGQVRIYTTSESDPWEYKVSQDTGCWITKKKDSAGNWLQIKGNSKIKDWSSVMGKLDRLFPSARTASQKAACPGKTSYGSAARSSGISTKGAEELNRRSAARGRIASPGRLGAEDIQLRVKLRGNSEIKTLDQLCGKGATERFLQDVVMDSLRNRLRTGGKANVLNSEQTLNIAVDFNITGKKVKSVKRVKGSEFFQLMRFKNIRGAIEMFFEDTMPVKNKENVINPPTDKKDKPDLTLVITMPAGVYSNLNESKEKELINLIRKMVKK